MVLYDVQDSNGRWYSAQEMQAEGARIGIECVPVLFDNDDENVDPFETAASLMRRIEEGDIKALLGGRPEGIVIKHPAYVKNADGPATAMKFKIVTKQFKEKQAQKKVRAERISPSDYVAWVGAHFDVPARLVKARQHLRTQHDVFEPTPVQLAAELDADLLKERRDEIEAYIWSHFKRYVSSLLTNGGRLKGAALERFDNDPVIAQLRLALKVQPVDDVDKADGKSTVSDVDDNLAVDVDAMRKDVVGVLLPAVCTAARRSLIPVPKTSTA
jgi:hypothetical protein